MIFSLPVVKKKQPGFYSTPHIVSEIYLFVGDFHMNNFNTAHCLGVNLFFRPGLERLCFALSAFIFRAI
jgi:hypothetical protein